MSVVGDRWAVYLFCDVESLQQEMTEIAQSCPQEKGIIRHERYGLVREALADRAKRVAMLIIVSNRYKKHLDRLFGKKGPPPKRMPERIVVVYPNMDCSTTEDFRRIGTTFSGRGVRFFVTEIAELKDRNWNLIEELGFV